MKSADFWILKFLLDNYSEMDNEGYGVSEEDKKLNREFYE